MATNGDWDYKRQKNTIYGKAYLDYHNQTIFKFHNSDFTAEDLGNYHYGYVGRAAGFSLGLLQYCAGLNQRWDGTSKEIWKSSSYDKPNDQLMIRLGFGL